MNPYRTCEQSAAERGGQVERGAEGEGRDACLKKPQSRYLCLHNLKEIAIVALPSKHPLSA
jgi:hypothetical protein